MKNCWQTFEVISTAGKTNGFERFGNLDRPFEEIEIPLICWLGCKANANPFVTALREVRRMVLMPG